MAGAEVVVVGGVNVDVKCRPVGALTLGTSNPGITTCTPGGVGRNIAEALAHLGVAVALVSVVGDDPLGAPVLAHTRGAGVDIDAVRVLAGTSTGTYTAVLDEHGQLVVAISAMEVLQAMDTHDVERAILDVVDGGVLVIDANIEPLLVAHALVVANACGVRVVIDPVSVAKAARLGPMLGQAPVEMLTPNIDELWALVPHEQGDLAAACRWLHDAGTSVVWVRAGSDGSWISRRDDEPVHIPTVPQHDVADVTGAGDAALAGYLWARQRSHGPIAAAQIGTAAALATLRSPNSVSESLGEAVNRAAALVPIIEEPS